MSYDLLRSLVLEILTQHHFGATTPHILSVVSLHVPITDVIRDEAATILLRGAASGIFNGHGQSPVHWQLIRGPEDVAAAFICGEF